MPTCIVALIFYYLGFMAAGDVAAYLLGSTVEYEWGSQMSLIVFLGLYFLFLWIAWVLAVWVTKPKSVEPQLSLEERLRNSVQIQKESDEEDNAQC